MTEEEIEKEKVRKAIEDELTKSVLGMVTNTETTRQAIKEHVIRALVDQIEVKFEGNTAIVQFPYWFDKFVVENPK